VGKIRTCFYNMRLRTKFLLILLALALIAMTAAGLVTSWINYRYINEEIEKSGRQVTETVDGNISLILDNVTKIADIIYFDKDVQNSLKDVASYSENPDINKSITDSLVNMVLSSDYISGAYILDRDGHFYRSYNEKPKKIEADKIPETSWYQSLSGHQGNGFFIHGSDGIIQYASDKDYITYIREIRDVDTYESLALLMVTVDETTIRTYFNKVSSDYDTSFFIADKDGNYVVRPENKTDEIKDNLPLILGDKDETVPIRMDDQTALSVKMPMTDGSWYLVGIFEKSGAKQMLPYYYGLILLIIGIAAGFVVFGSILINFAFFRPLEKLELQMQLVDEGRLEPIETDDSRNEISRLKTVFNHMIHSIKNLIEQVREEQQTASKNELDLLLSQVNPHFLYNTLDTASALALMGENEECAEMIQAVGKFYRVSLSGGRQVVTVRDEIECVKNYVRILNIRYGDTITVKYSVDEELLDCEVLKLILQPIVENAIHHGINAKYEKGTVCIRVYSDMDDIFFSVKDDGSGISGEKIQDILNGKAGSSRSGYGLHSIIERIRLYYGIEEPMSINSSEGCGTEIILHVTKMPKEDRGNENPETHEPS
jgi:two-component system sensor histidine kinase YesM